MMMIYHFLILHIMLVLIKHCSESNLIIRYLLLYLHSYGIQIFRVMDLMVMN